MTSVGPYHEPGRPCLVGVLLSDDSEVSRIIHPVRDLTEEHCGELLAATKLVSQLTLGNPYFALARAHERWAALVGRCYELLDEEYSDELEAALDHELSARFDGVLFSFRAFIDHSDNWAKDNLTASSRAAIKKQTSTEYDNFFEYRLAWNLRNTAQHAATVLAVSQSSKELATGGVAHTLELLIAANIPTENWQPRVRQEFQALQGQPINAIDVLQCLMGSCERIVARLLIEAEPVVLPALDVVLPAIEEVRSATGDEHAAIAVLDETLTQDDEGLWGGPMKMAPVRADYSYSLVDMLRAAHRLLDD